MVDLSDLVHETTHTLNVCLEDGAGFINILLSISGTTGTESVSDLSSYNYDPRVRENTVRKYVSEVIVITKNKRFCHPFYFIN